MNTAIRIIILVTLVLLSACGDLGELGEEMSDSRDAARPTVFVAVAENQELVQEALGLFYGLRDVPGLKKRPGTSELIDWIRLLVIEDVAPDKLSGDGKRKLPPFLGALIKNEQDLEQVTGHLGRKR